MQQRSANAINRSIEEGIRRRALRTCRCGWYSIHQKRIRRSSVMVRRVKERVHRRTNSPGVVRRGASAADSWCGQQGLQTHLIHICRCPRRCKCRRRRKYVSHGRGCWRLEDTWWWSLLGRWGRRGSRGCHGWSGIPTSTGNRKLVSPLNRQNACKQKTVTAWQSKELKRSGDPNVYPTKCDFCAICSASMLSNTQTMPISGLPFELTTETKVAAFSRVSLLVGVTGGVFLYAEVFGKVSPFLLFWWPPLEKVESKEDNL